MDERDRPTGETSEMDSVPRESIFGQNDDTFSRGAFIIGRGRDARLDRIRYEFEHIRADLIRLMPHESNLHGIRDDLDSIRDDLDHLHPRADNLSSVSDNLNSIRGDLDRLTPHVDQFTDRDPKLIVIGLHLRRIRDELREIASNVRSKAVSAAAASMKSSESVQMTDEISVAVYLETDDSAIIAQVTQYVDELVAALGYGKPIDPITERGSFLRNSVARIKKTLTADEVKEVVAQARRAAELRYLDSQQAEVDNKIAETLSNLIASLAEVPSAFVKAGSILLIKYPGPHGPVISVKNLSDLEIRTLQRFPEIQREPHKALESLALALSELEPEAQQGHQ